jgi:hypothetical protein
MNKRDDHSRVAIWTECYRVDTLLTVPHFRMPRGYRMDHSGLGRTRKETYGQYEPFCSLSHRSRAWHSLQQRGVCNLETTSFRIAVRFVAAGLLTAEMVM